MAAIHDPMVFILMNSFLKLESFGYKQFWIVGGGQGLPSAFTSENCTQSLYFDKMSKMNLLWRIFCTLMKRTDLFRMKAFAINSFTNQIVTFLIYYD